MSWRIHYKARLIVIALLSVAILSAFLIFFPSILLGPQGFARQLVYQYLSPDGQYKINVHCQVNFPATEFIDPTGTVTVSLLKAKDDSLLDKVEFQVVETGDLTEPALLWSPNEVFIDRI